jgi:uncharacterized protein (TIGR03437 family)
MLRTSLAASWAALSFTVLLAQENSSLTNNTAAATASALPASPQAGSIPVNSWASGTPMPTARMGPFTGSIGNKVYVIGGQTDSGVLAVNEIYDTVADTWTFGTPMPTARWNGASAVVGNILYAIGGQNSNALSVVEAYDPLSDTWTTKAPMPFVSDSMYATVVGNIIYVVGGFNPASGRLTTVLAYNTATNTWSAVASLKVGKSQSALGVFGSTIVSAGGLLASSNATTDNEAYNVNSNIWTTLAPLPSARHAGCFESAGNTLYFAGGHSIGNGNPSATMDGYNADTNNWTSGLPSMPHAAVNMGSASSGGRLYCFGGSNEGNPQTGTIYNYVQIYQPDIPPAISPGGVVSASAFGQFTSVAPGSWIEIYGANLAPDTRGWAAGDFTGNTAPTSLDNVSVSIGGKQAFIDYINPGQINALLSSDTPTGPQQLTVTNTQGTSAAYNITVNATEPGLLAPPSFSIGGVQYAVAIFTDGAYALPTGAIAGVTSRPARPGDVITLYGVGFGPVTPDIPAGQLAQQLNTLASNLQLSIGGLPASVLYSGLAPGFTGLYQFNITVPAVPAGNQALTFTLGATAGTQTLYIASGQ